jgi:hypothetical protein
MPKLDVVAILKQQHGQSKAKVNWLEETIRILERCQSRRSGISAAGKCPARAGEIPR